MDHSAIVSLVENLLVVLALGVAYDVAGPSITQPSLRQRLLAGAIVGTATIGVMTIPWRFAPGIFFDGRSVVLSLCGLFFGAVPTAVATAMAAVYRAALGGDGVVTGIATVVVAGLVGTLWRAYRPLGKQPAGPLELVVLALVVHVGVLLCFFAMPLPVALDSIRKVGLLFATLFPAVTVLLGMLLEHKGERARAAARLLESEARFRRLAENAADLIYRYRLKPTPGFEYVSPSAHRMTGFTPEDHYANPGLGLELVHPEDRPMLEAMMASGQISSDPLRLRWVRRDGSIMWTEQRNVPVYDEHGALVAIEGVARDVSARVEAERSRASMQSQLQHAQKMEAVGRLAGGVAHDFNNMLSVILAGAELAREELGADHPAATDLDDVLDAARRSAALTRQLLTFSRVDAEEQVRFDVNQAVRDSHKMLARMIGEDIEIVLDLEDDPWSVRMDPAHLDQVLANLAVNARDAIEGHGRVSVKTRNVRLKDVLDATGARHDGDYVELEFADSGVGMDPETLARVFEPFFTTKGPGKGTGLGLSTLYGIVRRCGGLVSVHSEVGQGTRFVLCLPRDARDDEKAQTAGVGTDRGGVERVLIVEDEAGLCRTTTRMLTRLGYSVRACTSPLAAVEIIRDETLDLVLSDLVMPEMSGLHLRDAVSSLSRGPRFLFMSGYAQQVIEERGLDGASLPIVKKPFSSQVLAAAVRTALDRGPDPTDRRARAVADVPATC